MKEGMRIRGLGDEGVNGFLEMKKEKGEGGLENKERESENEGEKNLGKVGYQRDGKG